MQAAPRHAALPDVLLLLTSAQEFDWVKLRRDEKALMKARALQPPSPAFWSALSSHTVLAAQTLNATVRFPLLDERGKPIKGASRMRRSQACRFLRAD